MKNVFVDAQSQVDLISDLALRQHDLSMGQEISTSIFPWKPLYEIVPLDDGGGLTMAWFFHLSAFTTSKTGQGEKKTSLGSAKPCSTKGTRLLTLADNGWGKVPLTS